MKTFLAVYTGSPTSMQNARFEALNNDEKQKRMAEGIGAWHAWVDKYRDFIVDKGTPLGRTKSVSPSGIVDIRNNLTAYTVVRSESHEEAAKMFENHPHFMIFPGDTVEIMECLPIPD